jgi:catechol 2,3-dioxygenase-like lactoylglutathione lyase family enzyme
MTTVSVRCIVNDVEEAIAFYCAQLGFTEVMHPAPAFAMLSRGDLRLVLSASGGGPGGGQAMPDGTLPAPGGGNRFAIEVSDLDGRVSALREQGARFPQRHRHRGRWPADPGRGPVRQPGRAVRAHPGRGQALATDQLTALPPGPRARQPSTNSTWAACSGSRYSRTTVIRPSPGRRFRCSTRGTTPVPTVRD